MIINHTHVIVVDKYKVSNLIERRI